MKFITCKDRLHSYSYQTLFSRARVLGSGARDWGPLRLVPNNANTSNSANAYFCTNKTGDSRPTALNDISYSYRKAAWVMMEVSNGSVL